MHGYRRVRASLVAATATALLCAGTAVSAAAPTASPAPTPAPAPVPAPAAPAAQPPAERLIVGYKSMAQEAKSDEAAAKDAAAKGRKAGEAVGFDRRLGTGAALIDLEKAKDAKSLDAVMDAFRADPDVAYVVPDRRVYATAVTPNDTEYRRQWDLFESTAGMNVPTAWDKATGEGVKVAVIDTGYVPHSDLAANMVAGYDFISDPFMANDGGGRDSNAADPGDWMLRGECGDNYPEQDYDSSWHGTHVAGTIAAAAGNGKGIAGVAYDATVQPVRVLGKCGGTTSDIIDAITWASGGYVAGVPGNPYPADVINMSLGGGGACDAGTQSAVNAAVNRGTTVVVAAGNTNTNAAGFNPANCANVITVAASDREGNRASYSNYGSVVDITAPGGETAVSGANGIWSTLNSGSRGPVGENYEPYQGTSMAAPHIAGLAALMYEANPSITPAQVESTIKAKARTLPGYCSGGCGAGLADATATLGAGGGTTPPTGTVFANTADVTIRDNTTVASSIAVSGVSGYAPSDLKVDVDIKHTYRGDLKVELVAPSGASALLKDTSTGDSADNVLTTYTVDASSVYANGTWKLRVTDAYTGDTGYIDSWSLTF
ncbi:MULTISPECIES: S8 family peptidase [Streptomyces]|uniref:Protease n=2 Tax=Streptomyces fradiae TaxID=1906 RepID=A0A1Y2NXK4_STRFR|nr:protease [Streptomyces fradiae ATCC 10745 = DSM 40063]KAF0650540.1 protease [Streptomyces fradiae ATCC 10745 = DSM 40063]OSY52090.1 Extracellular basic protease precursor [Streptomyces fradiae ATCC 10745 = DSM 40063]